MMKKILIGYAKGNEELLNRQSALGSYILTLAKMFDEIGYQVQVNNMSLSELLAFPYTQSPPPIGRAKLSKWIPNFCKQIVRDLKCFSFINQLIENISVNNFKPDFILEFYVYGSNLGLRLKNLYRTPLFTVFDSPVLEEHEFFNGRKRFFRNEILSRQFNTLSLSDNVVVYSQAVKDYCIKNGIERRKISIHQNIDFSRFDFLDVKFEALNFNIVFIGSFLKWHKVECLVYAFKKLLDENLPVSLQLIGYGMEFAKISELVNKLGLREKVYMPGFCDGQQLLDLKKKAHIGVMPGSNWYGAPNKVFEYAAAGLLVLAPATPTIDALFSEDSGLIFFEDGNSNEMYLNLKWAVSHWNEASQKAKTFQSYIQSQYSGEKTIDFYTHLFSGEVS